VVGNWTHHLLTKKDAKPRFICWILVLQEFYLQNVDRKGEDNPVAYHLSRMEGIPYYSVPINDSFPGESLAVVQKIVPRFANYANFLVGKYLPPDMNYNHRKKFFSDLKYYFWDYPFLYRHGLDGMIRQCITEHGTDTILRACHSSSYAGHHVGDHIAAKVLQSGFYWLTLFKDAHMYTSTGPPN
jgi:hypothetical protein